MGKNQNPGQITALFTQITTMDLSNTIETTTYFSDSCIIG